MKHFLSIVLFCSLFTNAGAQTVNLPTTNGEIVYEVIDSALPGKTKSQLYIASKLWAFDHFNDLRKVIQIDDSTNGMIAGKGSLPFYIQFLERSGTYSIHYSFKIDSKDGKYRAQFYNFYFSSADTGEELWLEYVLAHPKKRRLHKNYLVRIDASMKRLTEDLKKRIQSDDVTSNF